MCKKGFKRKENMDCEQEEAENVDEETSTSQGKSRRKK